MAGESRTDLLRWLNELLQLDYKRVELCGTGAAFCQLLDYVHRDMPMPKVKFDINLEYEYRNNWKILQSGFTRHKITKVIDVDRLVKCRLQDNLELLQWFKKYCTEKHPLEGYDPVGRRAGQGGAARAPRPPSAAGRRVLSGLTPIPPTSRRTLSLATPVLRNSTPPQSANGLSGAGAGRPPSAALTLRELAETQRALDQANLELANYKNMCDLMETERNFYFNKLREIEILSQNILDMANLDNLADMVELTVPELMAKVQQILYRVDDGFQLNEVDAESC